MKISPFIKNILFVIIGLILFSLDRVLKYLAQNNFFQDKFIGIENVFKLEFFKNENIAFSIPTGNEVALVISIIILILFITYYILKTKNSSIFNLHSSLVFIFLGTISNIFDRIKFGYVVDYINFINLNVFNLSDVLILLGFTIFTIKEIKWSQR